MKNKVARTGDTTSYDRLGKKVTRKRFNDVGNPSKNLVQDANRRRWMNVMNLWRAWDNISWKPRYQTKGPGKTNYNVFTALAIQGTDIYLPKKEALNTACVLVPLTISNGTLPTIDTKFDGTGVRSDINVGNLAIGPDTKISELAQAILSNNQNFQKGDILTFVSARQEIWPPFDYPHVSFSSCSLPLDTHDDRPLSVLQHSAEAFCVREGFLASTIAEGACTWVHERQGGEDGKDQPYYSTQTFWCSNEEMINRYHSQAALDASIESYKPLPDTEFLTPDPQPEDLAGKLPLHEKRNKGKE